MIGGLAARFFRQHYDFTREREKKKHKYNIIHSLHKNMEYVYIRVPTDTALYCQHEHGSVGVKGQARGTRASMNSAACTKEAATHACAHVLREILAPNRARRTDEDKFFFSAGRRRARCGMRRVVGVMRIEEVMELHARWNGTAGRACFVFQGQCDLG